MKNSVLFQLLALVVVYLLMLTIVFKGYKSITHKRLNQNLVTPAAIVCLAISVAFTLLITLPQNGG